MQPTTILNDDTKHLIAINLMLPQNFCILHIVVIQACDHFSLQLLPVSPIDALVCHFEGGFNVNNDHMPYYDKKNNKFCMLSHFTYVGVSNITLAFVVVVLLPQLFVVRRF